MLHCTDSRSTVTVLCGHVLHCTDNHSTVTVSCRTCSGAYSAPVWLYVTCRKVSTSAVVRVLFLARRGSRHFGYTDWVVSSAGESESLGGPGVDGDWAGFVWLRIRYGEVVGACDRDNGALASTKCGQFLDFLRNC